MEVVHMENTPAMAYSKNKTTIVLYPICVEYKVDGIVKKGAVVFLSDGKIMMHSKLQLLKGACLQL